MDLSNLKPAVGSVKERKRIGRGAGSGLGGTSTRGHKGAKSRSGYSNKIGFEMGFPVFAIILFSHSFLNLLSNFLEVHLVYLLYLINN